MKRKRRKQENVLILKFYLCYSYIGIFVVKDEVKELHPVFETENNSSVVLLCPGLR